MKTNRNDDIEKYKARLVAKGYSQREGIDYFETFAPVVRYESIRILLAIAAKEDFEISKFDVKTAFLNGDLAEDIYMEQPRGFEIEEQPDLVCKLRRSLYGLKQSPRCWNTKFVKFLEKFNFKHIESDKCIFVGTVKEVVVFLALYVDDGLVLSKSQAAINEVLAYLQANFKITIGDAKDFIGLEIDRNRSEHTLKIGQSSYIKKILRKFNMEDANSSSIPAEPGLRLSKSECLTNNNEKTVKNDIPYREAVGSLLFAARVSRPDIEYSVNRVSQFLTNYNNEHWCAVKRILRYLKGTVSHGIIYGKSGSDFSLQGYTDADYAGCIDTRKSTNGYVFLLNGGPITWSSQRQSVVALSTTEAEYIALAHGTKEAIWLRRMLNELGIGCSTVNIKVDNQSAIKLAHNPEFHKRSKHVDVRFHFIREKVEHGEVEVTYVNSKEQLADIFTKPLPKQQFIFLRDAINVIDDTK